ncbi:MAG: LysR family transcriptional regulator, partial [Solirubrobacteraceae bacterium]
MSAPIRVAAVALFRRVAEEWHFGRAAERWHMSQSPLSRSMRDLERELGAVLFARTTRCSGLSGREVNKAW